MASRNLYSVPETLVSPVNVRHEESKSDTWSYISISCFQMLARWLDRARAPYPAMAGSVGFSIVGTYMQLPRISVKPFQLKTPLPGIGGC